MIKIGVVGEDPNDTSAIKNLLDKRYKGKVQFFTLAKGVRGFQLDTPKLKKILPIEFAYKKCRFILYIRDLDAFKSEHEKLQAKINWFKSLDAEVNNKDILLLNIWELEALILGDIDTFNKNYGVSLNFKGDPMLQKYPKKTLKRITSSTRKEYEESHCPELFKQLDIDIIEKNCGCFRDFIEEFDKKIA